MNNLLLRLAKLICQVLNAEYCLIVLLDPTKKYSVMRCLFSPRKKYLIDKKMRLINRLELRVVNTCSSVLNSHFLATPLIAEDMTGLIVIRRKNTDMHFDSTDQKILMILTEQSVMGIKNLQLYEEQQKILLGAIKALVTLLDTRIPQEYTHSPYFNRLVTAIAQQMQVNNKEIKSLQYASMLHDAGKIDIPLEILTKTTKLSTKELDIIKKHPLKGVQLLRPLQFLKPAIPIILHHHERYDGKGYPSKLKGNTIPLGARVMSVADAFEAMIYGRPYRQRLKINCAIKEIKSKSGTQFDPKVVEAFLKAIKFFKVKKYLKLIRSSRYNK
jgi:HD-GYP domain-containing protein (c-di-GMP phosphodiesterase class II)